MLTRQQIEREAYRILVLSIVELWREYRHTPLEKPILEEMAMRAEGYRRACEAVDAEKRPAEATRV